MTTRAFAILASLVLTTAAAATDVALEGSRIQIVDSAGSAGRRTYVAMRDGSASMPIPDPTVMGAKAFIGPVGAEPVVELDLPASGWSGSTRRGFKFKSRDGSIVTAWLGAGRVRFSARGNGAFPLGAPLGGLGVIVEVGDVRYCGFFGGVVTKDDGTRFQARRAPAPAICPELGPTTTTTSTSTSTTSSSSSTSTSTTLPSCGELEPNVVPSGDYELSCFRCSVTGCSLRCGCADGAHPPSLCFNDPQYCVYSSLDLATCRAGTVANSNGTLTCVAP